MEELSRGKQISFERFELEDDWWLRRLFKKVGNHYPLGVLAFYFIVISPHIYLILSTGSYRELVYLASDFLIIFVPLVLVDLAFNSLERLKREMNAHIQNNSIRLPPKDEYSDSVTLKANPLYSSLSTLNKLVKLPFDSYHLGLMFAIAIGILGAFIAYANLELYMPTIPDEWIPYNTFKLGIIWFVMGHYAWVGIIFLIIGTYSSRYTFSRKTQKPISFYYKPILEVSSWFWKLGGYAITVLIPIIILGAFLVGKDLVEPALNYVTIWLMVILPVLVSGSLVAVSRVAKTMENARIRKLRDIESKLEELEEKIERKDELELNYKLFQIQSDAYKELQRHSSVFPQQTEAAKLILALSGPPLSLITSSAIFPEISAITNQLSTMLQPLS